MPAKKPDPKPKKRDAKAADKAKAKQPKDAKSASKRKCRSATAEAPNAGPVHHLGLNLNAIDIHPCLHPLTSDVAKPTKADKAPEKPEKKTRQKRAADAPKKPMSAFFWYQQDRRTAIKQERPELAHKDVIVVSRIKQSSRFHKNTQLTPFARACPKHRSQSEAAELGKGRSESIGVFCGGDLIGSPN